MEEVVVTATRQTSTVNKVPMSISAATQQTLDQQGIKAIADLQRVAPSLSVSNTIGGVQTFSIRGILATQGAATTGLYLDDVALQKRNVTGPGGNTTSNGSPAPPLFDLERVEVLRGPQGTLYGGSSEGGTIRFITPSPSLTTYSGLARAEASSVRDGDPSYEFGAAMGGPIIKDKLGFRASVLSRHTGGYIDMVDPYRNGALFEADANRSQTLSFRGALRWAPTDRASLTFSYLKYWLHDHGGLVQSNLPIDGTFTTPASCYNTTRQFGQTPSPMSAVPCPGTALPGQTVGGIYQRASATYGPFPYLGRNIALGVQLAPIETRADVASLTFDYDFGAMTMKAITAYLSDNTSAQTLAFSEVATQQSTTLYPTARGFPLFAARPDFMGFMGGFNRRYGITQEVRFASAPGQEPLSWVAGVYYANTRGHAEYCTARDQGAAISGPLWGLTPLQSYGQPQAPCTNTRRQWLRDNEIAAFGEANIKVSKRLTATAGVRASREQYTFEQQFFGTTVGWLVPTFANTGLTAGSQTESPITPKFGLNYQFTPTQMVYATAAKGFRNGGVNTPLNPLICGPALAAAGLTVADIPATYASDSVWSYEAGGKFRLLEGRLQLNGSAYRIDWTNVQITVSGLAGCSQNWVQNAGTGRSQGFDLDAQAKLLPGLTATFALGYTKAEYTEAATAPKPLSGAPASIIVQKGDRFPVPVWQGNVGLRYEFGLGGSTRGYLRGDYFYQGGYLRTPGPGSVQFAPDIYRAPSTQQVNVRAGVMVAGWEVNVFANNLLDSQDEVTRGSVSGANTTGGRTGCSAGGAACTTFSSYDPFLRVGTLRPREVGVQTSYRF